jgi:hypothetical protein
MWFSSQLHASFYLDRGLIEKLPGHRSHAAGLGKRGSDSRPRKVSRASTREAKMQSTIFVTVSRGETRNIGSNIVGDGKFLEGGTQGLIIGYLLAVEWAISQLTFGASGHPFGAALREVNHVNRDHSTHHIDTNSFGRSSDLAIQQRVGLLPFRWTRVRRRDSAYSCSAWSRLSANRERHTGDSEWAPVERISGIEALQSGAQIGDILVTFRCDNALPCRSALPRPSRNLRSTVRLLRRIDIWLRRRAVQLARRCYALTRLFVPL